MSRSITPTHRGLAAASVVVLVALAACQASQTKVADSGGQQAGAGQHGHGQHGQGRGRGGQGGADLSGLGNSGLGVSVLASIDNAREALALHDATAAANDIDQAVDTAEQLHALPSPLFPDAAIGAGAGPAQQSDFQLRVNLGAARIDLQNGDTAAAASLLATARNSVPAKLVPANLPLVQAQQSLGFAQTALSTGETGELRTQLQCAQQALGLYSGGRYAQEVGAIATAIGANLGALDRIGLYQPSEWASVIAGWSPPAAAPDDL